MVATQVFLAVFTISVAVAAPQLGSRRTVTTSTKEVTSSPDQIVSSVISSLQQPIALAVAEALRSLQTTNSITTTGSAAGISSGLVSDGGAKFFTNSANGVAGSSIGATGGLVVVGQSSESSSDDIFVRPEYNFEFKVSDDMAQTYMSQKEERDGDDVIGSYSYIDANGALVTVNYKAGVGGYQETREVKEGVVEIRPIIYEDEEEEMLITAGEESSAELTAAKIAAARNADAAQRAAATQRAAAQRAAEERAAAAQRAAEVRAAAAQRVAAQTTASALNSNALIAQILAAIQPQIGAAVQNAIGSTRSSSVAAVAPITRTTSVQAVSSPVVTSSISQSSGLSSLFGLGGNVVRIATPKFQVEY